MQSFQFLERTNAVHTGTERLRINFVLCLDGNAIVPLTCFPSACSVGKGTIAHRFTFRITLGHSISWNGTVLVEVFQCERRPSAFLFSEQYGTKRNDCVSV